MKSMVSKRLTALVLAGLLLFSSPVYVMGEAQRLVHVDFSKHTGIPLLKRQNTFSVSYSFGIGGDSSKFFKAAPYLKDLRSESMRVDLSMGNGGLGKFLARGNANEMTHEFQALDMLMKALYENGTAPYFSYGYMPASLQPENGNFRSAPVDFEAWGQLCADIAAHYAEKGWPLAAHEIWNEPDLVNDAGKHVFFSGTWQDYIRMYDEGARGIRRSNPLATVGGLSLAFLGTFEQSGGIAEFLDHVQEHSLPLDFISYHNYGTSRYLNDTRIINGILSRYGDAFSETGLHINEFHVVDDIANMTTEKASCAETASLMMQAIAALVEMPTVTSVNWATWRDNGEGLNMVDNRTGERFATHYVLQLYNDLPVDRVEFAGEGSVKGFAAADGQSAGVILYTRSVSAQQVKVALDRLPFEKADMVVYAIDREHSSVLDGCGSDELAVIDRRSNVDTEGLYWEGTLARRGILYIKLTPAGQTAERAPVWKMDENTPLCGDAATVVRKEYYFADRTTTAFSELDLGTMTAWAGMGNAEKGLSRGGAVLANVPQRLIFTPKVYGERDENAAFFLYAEYVDAKGNVTGRQALTHGDADYVPDGFDQADRRVLPLEDAFVLEAPEGFDGTLRLWWGMENAGRDVTMKLGMSK